MNKRGQVGALILIFIGAIVCIALLTQIINTQDLVTEKQTAINETKALNTTGCVVPAGGGQVNQSVTYPSIAACNITVNSAPTGWKLSDSSCALTSVTVRNITGGQSFVAGTDYNLFAQTGIIQMLNSTNTKSGSANTTLITYSFCGDGYNSDAGSRGIARTWTLFAVLGLLAFVIAVGLRKDWF